MWIDMKRKEEKNRKRHEIWVKNIEKKIWESRGEKRKEKSRVLLLIQKAVRDYRNRRISSSIKNQRPNNDEMKFGMQAKQTLENDNDDEENKINQKV